MFAGSAGWCGRLKSGRGIAFPIIGPLQSKHSDARSNGTPHPGQRQARRWSVERGPRGLELRCAKLVQLVDRVHGRLSQSGLGLQTFVLESGHRKPDGGHHSATNLSFESVVVCLSMRDVLESCLVVVRRSSDTVLAVLTPRWGTPQRDRGLHVALPRTRKKSP